MHMTRVPRRQWVEIGKSKRGVLHAVGRAEWNGRRFVNVKGPFPRTVIERMSARVRSRTALDDIVRYNGFYWAPTWGNAS